MEFYGATDSEFEEVLRQILSSGRAQHEPRFRVAISVSEAGSSAQYTPDPDRSSETWPIDLSGHGWVDPPRPQDIPIEFLYAAIDCIPKRYAVSLDRGWWRCETSAPTDGDLPFTIQLEYQPFADPTGPRIEWRYDTAPREPEDWTGWTSHESGATPPVAVTDLRRFDDDGVLVDSWRREHSFIPNLVKITELFPHNGPLWLRDIDELLCGWVLTDSPGEG